MHIIRRAMAATVVVVLALTIPAVVATQAPATDLSPVAGPTAAEIRTWVLEQFNQAVADSISERVGGLSPNCREVVLNVFRNGAPYDDLISWYHIARRESLCLLWVVNSRPPDYSVCWFQINYYGSLRRGRTAAFGPPELLQNDGAACARAALSLFSASGWAPWGGRA